MRRIWKDYFFEDLYNMYNQKCVAVNMCGFDGFGGVLINRNEAEAKVRKFKNGKAAGKHEVMGEMIKGGSDMAVEWIRRLCNMALESGVCA